LRTGSRLDLENALSEIALSPQEQRALYRRLVSQPEWLAYVGRFGAFHLRSPQNGWVTLFSSKADLDLAQAQAETPIQTVSMCGFEPFALHLGARAGVAIDPASPGGIHFKKSQLAHLEEWGKGAWIERLARHTRNEPWVARQLAAHASFWVLAEGTGSETRWLRGKAAGGKTGIALFAMPDAPYHFIEEQKLDLSKLRLLKFTGHDLFESLTAGASPQPVVLNPSGPGLSLGITGRQIALWLKDGQ
jgi:hypothetical protein